MEAPEMWEAAGQRLFDLIPETILPGLPYLHSWPANTKGEFEELTRFLYADARQCRAQLDLEAPRVAARRSVAPLSDPRAIYFLFLRIQCACDFVGQLFPPESAKQPFSDPPSDWDMTKLCRWLLVDLWNRRSDHWLKLVALELTGPFPFYGIEPAPDFG